MKRKLVGFMLVLVMVFTSLTGCGEKVTAESLIDNAFEDVENMELEMNMDIEMEVSASGMSADVSMSMKGDIETSEKASHVNMTVSMNMMDMEMEESVETYAVLDGDTVTTYTYDKDSDQWYYTETENEIDSNELSSDMFDNLEMEETDDGYEVTGVVKDVDEMMSGLTGDDTTEALVDGLKDIDVIATLIFNEDKEIEEMIITFDVNEDEAINMDGMGEVVISKMEVAVEFKSLDGDEVELPEEVEDNAISEEEYLGTGDDYFEDDYEDDYAEEGTEDAYESGNEMIPAGNIAGTNPPSLETIVFTFKGTEYTFDTLSLEVLKGHGYEVDDYSYTEGTEYLVAAGDYDYISLCDENICYVDLYYRNNTEGEIDILACDVAGFSVDQSYEMEYEGGCHCDFSIMGVAAGTTAADAENILGTPDDYYVYDDTITYYYYLDNNDDAALELEFDYTYGLTGFSVNKALFY